MKHLAQQFEINNPEEPFCLVSEDTQDGQRIQREREEHRLALEAQEKAQGKLFLFGE